MALMFNLSVLEEESKGNPKLFLTMLYFHWQKKIPVTPSNKKFRSVRPLDGSSYLLKPTAFYNDTKTDLLYRVQYIKLAARRDYLLFRTHGYKKLQLSYFPDINLSNIKFNPLLEISDTEITFKHEELKNVS